MKAISHKVAMSRSPRHAVRLTCGGHPGAGCLLRRSIFGHEDPVRGDRPHAPSPTTFTTREARESATLVLERRTRRGRTRLGDQQAHLPEPRIPATPPARTGSLPAADGLPDQSQPDSGSSTDRRLGLVNCLSQVGRDQIPACAPHQRAMNEQQLINHALFASARQPRSCPRRPDG